MNTDFPGDGIERRSLDEESVRHANEHKWYCSQRLGYDAGLEALLAWENEHWPNFLRARWIEHLRGARFWIELDRDEYGLLNKEFGEYREILDEIVELLMRGGENLNILCWARDCKSRDDQKKVRKILRILGINDKRRICKVTQQMSVCSPY